MTELPLTAASPSLYRHDDNACRELIADAFAHGLYVDVVFQTLDADDIVAAFFSHNIPECHVLFTGTKFDAFSRYSPYLCRIDGPANAFLAYLLNSPPGWGYVAISKAPFTRGVAHWQSLLEAELPDGGKTHLRLYDGNVFSRLLTACAPNELFRLMGPYDMLFVHGKDAEKPWVHAGRPSPDIAGAAVVAERWHKNPPTSLWKMEPHHFAVFAGPMRKVQVDNLKQALWREDAATALQLDAKHNGLEAFVERALEETNAFELEDHMDVEEYVLLRFHTDLVPAKAERLHAIMRNSGVSPSRRLDQGRVLLKKEAL